MQNFLKTKKFFQKNLENFQPPPPTEGKKLKFPNRRRGTEKIENFQQPPPRKTSAYTSICGPKTMGDAVKAQCNKHQIYFHQEKF